MHGGSRHIIETSKAEATYSRAFLPEQGVRLAAQARVTTEEDAYSVAVVLQGGWASLADQNNDENWIDLDFTATITTGVITPLETTEGATQIYAEWPVYRFKVTPDVAAVSVEARVTELG